MDHHFTKTQKNIAFFVLALIFAMVSVILITVNRISNRQAYTANPRANEIANNSVLQYPTPTPGINPPIRPTIEVLPATYKQYNLPAKNACHSDIQYKESASYPDGKACGWTLEFRCGGKMSIPAGLETTCYNNELERGPGAMLCQFKGLMCYNIDDIYKLMDKICTGTCFPNAKPTGIGIDPPANPY